MRSRIAFIGIAVFVVLIIYNTFPKTGGAPRLVTQPANRQAAANRVNNARPPPVEVKEEIVPSRNPLDSVVPNINHHDQPRPEQSEQTHHSHPIPEVQPPSQDTHHPTYIAHNHTAPAVTNTHAFAGNDVRVLIGVMSPFAAGARRQMIRHAYSHFPHLPVDVVFVQANLPTSNSLNAQRILDGQRNITVWENSTFGDIMHLDCAEVFEDGISYEYFRKVGLDLGNRYTHVMKTDENTFVNIPALVAVLRRIKDQTHLYWGTTWTDELRLPRERRGSTYLLSMDQVTFLTTSTIIPPNPASGDQDSHIVEWLRRGHQFDNDVVNRTAFAGYPWPELGDREYNQENTVRPFDRWTIVTSPLREAFMWVETAQYYLGLDWELN